MVWSLDGGRPSEILAGAQFERADPGGPLGGVAGRATWAAVAARAATSVLRARRNGRLLPTAGAPPKLEADPAGQESEAASRAAARSRVWTSRTLTSGVDPPRSPVLRMSALRAAELRMVWRMDEAGPCARLAGTAAHIAIQPIHVVNDPHDQEARVKKLLDSPFIHPSNENGLGSITQIPRSLVCGLGVEIQCLTKRWLLARGPVRERRTVSALLTPGPSLPLGPSGPLGLSPTGRLRCRKRARVRRAHARRYVD